MLSGRHRIQITVILSWIIIAVSLDACSYANAPPSNGLSFLSSGMGENRERDTSVSNVELDDLLTQSLQDNGLSGVGVHVWEDGMGHGLLILYGFVASTRQKRQAEEQARDIFGDFGFPVSNRIAVRAELLG